MSSNKQEISDTDDSLYEINSDITDASDSEEEIGKKRKRIRRSKRIKKQKKDDIVSQLCSTSDLSDDSEDKCKTKKSKVKVVPLNENLDDMLLNTLFGASNSTDDNSNWTKGLKKSQIRKYEPEYKLIKKKISKLPTELDILKTPMPFDVKCFLFEKIAILNRMISNTFEHLNLKKSIISEIEKYKNMKISSSTYKEFENNKNDLENECFDSKPLYCRIMESNYSNNNKSVIYNKYKHLMTLGAYSSEYSKLLNWINISLNIPSTYYKIPISIKDDSSKISNFLTDVKYKMDKNIYGMENTKEHILCALNNKITNPKSIGTTLALKGAQGTGKTKLIKVLSEAIQMPFTNIPLGGTTDSSVILGHNYTYEGSQPGLIVNSLIKMKSLCGIMYFDEIDKISTTRSGDDISKTLLHIMDFTQNDKFVDKYLGNNIKIDLSKIWFICSLNYTELLDKTLLDRLSIIEVNGYNNKQKLEMSHKFIIPELLENVGLKPSEISFTDNALNHIITITNKQYDKVTQDENGNSGVRKLKQALYKIITKINLLKNTNQHLSEKLSFNINNFCIPISITIENIDELKIFKKEKISHSLNMYL